MSSLSDIIELNVGGVHYETTRSTLIKYPDTMLAAMFTVDNDHPHSLPPAKVDKNGRYFIDRDGDVFKYILEYLRTGCLLLPDQCSEYECNKLQVEADYYQIPPLIDTLGKHKAKGSMPDAIVMLYRVSGTPKVYRMYGKYKTLLQVINKMGVTKLPERYDSDYAALEYTASLYYTADVVEKLGYVCVNYTPTDQCAKFIKYNEYAAQHSFQANGLKFHGF